MRSLAIVALTWLVAAPAFAQEINVTLRGVTGRSSVDLADLAMIGAAPLSYDECTSGATIDFRFTMVDQNRSQLHLYYGSNCEMVSVRNDTTDTSCVDLGLEYAIDRQMQVDVDIPISDLIDPTVPVAEACDSITSTTRTIFVLAIDNPTSEVSGAGQQVSFPLAFDFDGPSAPTEVSATDGETRSTVRWTSTGQVTRYEVYLVEDGCDAEGNVMTGVFDDVTGLTPAKVQDGPASSTTVEPIPGAIGSHHAIAVRGIDNAMNPGPLSAPVCMTKIDVTTFWDAYCSSADASEACSSSCSVSATPGRGALLGSLAALLAFAFVARRRIR